VLVNGGTVVLAKTSTAGVHAVAVDTTVNAGTLQLGGTGGDQIWDGDATNRTQVVVNGGVFDMNGRSEGFSILNGFGGAVANTAANTTSTLTLGTNNWSNTGFFGAIQDGAGVVALVKTGAGGLILAGNNTFSGGTTVAALGVVQLGNGGAGGTLGSGPVTNNGTLAFNRSDNFTFANVVSGPGRLVQNGSGTATVSGANTFTGSTTVNAGTLLVNGSIGGSAVTVNGGGTLRGTGSTGAVSVVSGGTLSPGASIGTLNTGPFSLFDGSILSIEIGSVTSDQVNVTGASLLEGNIPLLITLTADPVDGTPFTVINSTAGVTGYAGGARFVYAGNSLDEGEQFTVTSAPFNQIFEVRYAADAGNDVVLLAVPEPGTVVSLLGGFATLLGLQRFRRQPRK
jgi:autotransporter-associated beta strand protein